MDRFNQSTGVLLVLLITTSTSAPAHAYLDPGTGSMLLQGAIAAIAAAAFAIKTYWYRIKAFIKGEEWNPPSLLDDDTEEENTKSSD